MSKKIRVSVRKKPDRRFLMLYYVDPLTGKEISKSSGTNLRREADRAAARWESELESRTASSDISWEVFRSRFSDEHLDNLSRNGSHAYHVALDRFARDVGKPVRLNLIDANVMSRWMSSLRESGVSMGTVANYVRHVVSALSWAHRLGMISSVPKCKVPRDKASPMRARPITDDEFLKLENAIQKIEFGDRPGLARFMRGLWLSGLRLQEAFLLSWDSPPIRVDLDSGQFPMIEFQAAGQKNRKNERLPMTPDFVEFLRKTPIDQRKGKVFLIRSRRGEVIDAIRAAGREAKILVNDRGKHVTAHDLRRSFGTRWALKVHPMVLQRLMRHTNIGTTMSYYVSIDSDKIAEGLWAPIKSEHENVPASVPNSRRADPKK